MRTGRRNGACLMLHANDTPERRPFWKDILLVVAPAVATALVVEVGATVRDVLKRRNERRAEDDGSETDR